ncbi:hypothetical protein Ddc_15288 [Ditylenchus destructor]|nr:hypothetical protein Ddc_15288 [Ditylenchus destructor]
MRFRSMKNRKSSKPLSRTATKTEEIENTLEDEELNHLWIEFQDKCGFTGAGLSDYIDMDQNLATSGTPTIEEIIENYGGIICP